MSDASLSKDLKSKNAEQALLEELLTETSKKFTEKIEGLTSKIKQLESENAELKKKQVTFKSYAKASDTLTELQSHLIDPSEKSGLGPIGKSMFARKRPCMIIN